MEDINIYDDVSHVDLGNEILKLEDQNKSLLDHIRKLEGDIIKLCGELTNMKEKQQNLSRNISELYKTAKLELQRKERIIADLQQEVDDLKLGRKQNPQRYKRQFPCEKDGNEPPKRFKNNFNENETAWKSEKKERSLPRSIPENTDTYQTHDTDTSRVYRDYRNDETNRNSRYPSSSVRGRNRRNHRGRNNNRYGNRYRRSRSSERFRRSRSLERFRGGSKERDRRSRSKERDRRSRSKERDRRSKSNERDRRSRSIDQFSRNENQNRRRENPDGYRSGNNRRSRSTARQNSRKSEDPFSGRDLENYSDLRDNFVRDNNHHQKCIEVLDIADDSLEDGEISSESDNLVIEEDVRNTGDKRIASLSSKRDMKSISIEEYRSRNKIQEDETIAIECDTNIRKTVKTELLTATNDTAPQNGSEPKSDEKAMNDSKNVQEKTENSTPNNVSDFSLRSVEAKTPDNHILSKSITKEANDISLDDSNSGLKLAEDCQNSSVNSNNSSFANNSGNISNVSNTTPNGSVRQRRRRCVVIGLKEKV